MSVHGMQERASREAIHATPTRCRVTRRRPSVAAHGIAAGISKICIVNSELRVIKRIERFKAKF